MLNAHKRIVMSEIFFHFGRLISLHSVVLYCVNLVKTFYSFTALQHGRYTMDCTFAWNRNVVTSDNICHWFTELKTSSFLPYFPAQKTHFFPRKIWPKFNLCLMRRG
jgi:hypothetical protein